MRFVVWERHQAPLVSFHMRIRAGRADDPQGMAGIATILQRMFPHGSESLGGRNPSLEKKAIQEIDEITGAWDAARAERGSRESFKQEVEAKIALERMAGYGHVNFFDRVLEENLAADISYQTTADDTSFAVTLPASRAEIWFKMFGDWLRQPAWRRFQIERYALFKLRESDDATPESQLDHALLASAFTGHPYERLAASPGEIVRMKSSDAQTWRNTHYRPSNIVTAIVGDVTVAEARRLAEAYFGKLPKGASIEEKSEEKISIEAKPPVDIRFEGPRMLVAAWVRPPLTHPDSAAFEMLHAVMLRDPDLAAQRSLTGPKSPAARLRIRPDFPGERYQSLFSLELFLRENGRFEEADKSIQAYLEKMTKDPLPAKTILRARRFFDAAVAGLFEAPPSSAALLARAEVEFGSMDAWRKQLSRVEAVSAEDLHQVMQRYFSPSKRILIRLSRSGSGGGP